MTDFISVIIPTYNPNIARLEKTLSALRGQTLPFEHWELLIVDNNSTPPVTANLSWHTHHKTITAVKPGLTHARLKGFKNAAGNIIVMVDDDNMLDSTYLANTLTIFQSNNMLGAIGGKSLPVFEQLPPAWLKEFHLNLALRDLGDNVLVSGWNNEYPPCSPIGAGMGVRKSALKSYIRKSITGDTIISDRNKNTLSSGGDNDMVLEILKSGWQVGYFPSLVLKHVIPQQRMQVSYLARLLNHTNKSWIQVLESHHINHWHKIPGWTTPLRKLKAWFTYKAWKNNVNYIKWRGACGLFDGLAEK
jgi:glycosyltransferase involved in cell wall biosynthesis